MEDNIPRPPPPRNPTVDACSVQYLCLFYSALQKEHKVIRLESQAIHTNHSYMLDEMVPDQIVPYLVERRLLSPEKAQDVIGSRLQKASTILQALNEKVVVGTLPTFCASLISAGQPHIAERLDCSENYIVPHYMHITYHHPLLLHRYLDFHPYMLHYLFLHLFNIKLLI